MVAAWDKGRLFRAAQGKVSWGRNVAEGTGVFGTILFKVHSGSTLKTSEQGSLLPVSGRVPSCRESATTRGRRSNGDGVHGG